MQLSEVIVSTRKYYREICGQPVARVHNSLINRQEFEKRLEELKVSTDRQDVKDWLEQMDYDKRGYRPFVFFVFWRFILSSVVCWYYWQIDSIRLVHMFSWSGLIDMNHLLSDIFKMPNLQTGQMKTLITALTDEEEEMFKNMMRRLHTIARVWIRLIAIFAEHVLKCYIVRPSVTPPHNFWHYVGGPVVALIVSGGIECQ